MNMTALDVGFRKSQAISFLLVFFLGCLGLFYASVKWAIIILLANIFAVLLLLLGIFGGIAALFGLGLLAIVVLYVASLVLSITCVESYNREHMALMMSQQSRGFPAGPPPLAGVRV